MGYTYLLDWSISLKLSFNLTLRGFVVLQVDKRSIKSSTTKHTPVYNGRQFSRQWNLQVLQQTVSCMDLQRHWDHYSDHLTDKKNISNCNFKSPKQSCYINYKIASSDLQFFRSSAAFSTPFSSRNL